MDIATLGVNIKYDSVKQAGDALDKFSQSGEKAEKATKSLTSATDTLKQVLSGLTLGAVAMQAIKVADAYTQMQSNLRLVTQSTQELLAVQSQLNKVAIATFAEQGAVTELYAKMQPSLAALGKTTQDTVKFVETFNKALALTNPSAAQAQAAILQFSQAMGSGVLRGDEFNSMMENANGVMQKLAIGMGVPIGALREMAHEGKLTADVVYAALNNATESINSDFDKMALTVSNASQTIETGIFNLVGAINNATGATSSLAEVMHDFGQVLNLAANYVDIYAQASAEAEAKTKGMSGILDTASQSATNLHDVFRQVASVAYDVGTGIDMIVLGLGGLVATMASVGDSKQMQIVLQDTRKELDMIIKRNFEFKESLNIKSQTAQTVEGLKSIDEELKDIFGSSYEAEKATIKFTGSNKGAEKAAKAHAKALKEQAKTHLEAIEALDKQVEAISKAEKAFRKYINGSDFTSQVDELNEVTKAWKVLADNGLATTEDLQKAIDAVTMERFGTESQKAAEKMVENIDYAVEAMKASIKRLDDAFADVWRDIFNGAEDFGSSLKRWFTSLLAELAHAAITKPIVISMTGAMGFGGSGGAMASSIGSSAAGSYIGSSLGSIGAGLGAFGAGATATLSSWGSAVGLTSATSQAGMLAAQTGAFGAQGAALTGQAMAGAGNSIMSTIGAAAPYVAAFAVLDTVLGGKITSGITTGITGGDYELKHLTAKLNASADKIDSSIIKIERKDGGWGRKSKSRTTDLATAELDQAMQDMYSAVYDSVAENAARLGFAVAENFTASVEMSVKGKSSEEIMQSFNEMFTQIGDKLVESATVTETVSKIVEVDNGFYRANKTVTETITSVKTLADVLLPFQQEGEASYQTLSRLTAQFDAFNYPIGRLNDTLATLNITTLGAVDSLVSMAGGMQNLQAMQSNFINAFYTDAQKAELTTQTVTAIFDSIGQTAPHSREALVDLVKSLDLTTESGQKAFVAITSSSSMLDSFYKDLESGASSALNALKQTLASVNSQISSLQQTIAKATTLSTTKPATQPSSGVLVGGTEITDLTELEKTKNKLITEASDYQEALTTLADLEAKYKDLTGGSIENWVEKSGFTMADAVAGGTDVDYQSWIDLTEKVKTQGTVQTQLDDLITNWDDYVAKLTPTTAVETDIITTPSTPTDIITTPSCPYGTSWNGDSCVSDIITTAVETVEEAYKRLTSVVKTNEQIAQDRISLEQQIATFGKTEVELREMSIEGMDSYNASLQRQLWALKDAAIEQEKANALAAARTDMMSVLTDLIDQEGALTRARELELSAMDESLRSIQSSIWAISDAKDAVAAAEDALIDAVDAEKARLQDALNDEINALQDAHDDRVQLLQNEADAISQNLSKLKSFQSSLKSIVDTLMPKYSGATALRDATTEIMGYVASGVIPEQEAVQQALDTINAQDKTYYSTYEDYVLDQARANVATTKLLTLIDSGIVQQEATLQTVTDQIENEGLALAKAMAKAQATYELELARLDSILESYGVLNNSVLSVRDAVQALEGALARFSAASKPYVGAATSNPYVGSVPSNAAPGVKSAYEHSSGVNVSASDSATLAAAKLVYQSATGGVSTAQFNSAAAAVGGDIYAATGWNGDPASFRAMWGFANGGYTGNMATDAIAGVVHGREYVVNAKTTRDLGLNNQGGVFVQMANELTLLRQEVADLKAQDRQIGVQLIKQTRATADTLDRWDSVGKSV